MPGLNRPLVCPVLIGRDTEAAALASILDGSPTAAQRVICISGEAGIGKSRLAATAVSLARERGWRTVITHCYEQDHGLAYAAAADLLRQLADSGELIELLPQVGGTVARLLPGLRDLSPAEVPADERGEPEQETRRIFASISSVLGQVTGKMPLLLVVEDLHWADAGTLDWLAFLARTWRDSARLIVATYRSDEVEPPLRHLLAALERERLSAELPLIPLSLAEVEAMIRATLADESAVRADALQSLHRRAEGNPFLVEELLRSALAGAMASALNASSLAEARIPVSVQDALAARVTALSADAHDLLSVAAVIGDRFDAALLQAVSGRNTEALLPLLHELADQQLLVESGDAFRFRHSLTRDAVLASSLASERRALHARIADAIVALPPEQMGMRAEELAYHSFEAGQWERALTYAGIAGERAVALHAPASAVDYFTRAIEATHRMNRPLAPDILVARASAFEALANFDAARNDFQAAITAAEATQDDVALQDGLLGLALLWSSRDYARTREYLDRAVKVARARNEPAALARALNRLGNWYSNAGHYDESRACLDEALAIARSSSDDRLLAETIDLLGMTTLIGGRFVESRQFLLEAAEAFGRLGDTRNQSSPLASVAVLSGTYQSGMMPPALTLREAADYVQQAVQVARKSGSPSAIAYALWQLGFVLGARGEYARALATTQEALQIAESNEHRQWALAARMVLGALTHDLLESEQAIPLLETAYQEARALGSAIWIHQGAALFADALLTAGRIEEAQALVDRGYTEIRAEPGLAIAPAWYGAVAIDIALARRDYASALALIEENFPDGGTRIRLARGRALAGLSRTEEAAPAFEAAIAFARGQGDVAIEWRALADLAHARLVAGDRVLARAAADAASEIIERIATKLDDEAVARSFRKRATLRLPATLHRRTSRSDAQGLSPRELDVARLVARGLSNRAIADELVLGVRTVETHVANAMARVGQASRAGLASWVTEHGLLEAS